MEREENRDGGRETMIPLFECPSRGPFYDSSLETCLWTRPEASHLDGGWCIIEGDTPITYLTKKYGSLFVLLRSHCNLTAELFLDGNISSLK